ncbi:hypothetical protein TNCV_720841 [Trichonephila clavipes]|nr:hypothetical protein TNCV_720841 [Trichonephila clavipes]
MPNFASVSDEWSRDLESVQEYRNSDHVEMGKLVHALLDSGTEITVIKKDLVLEYRLKELPRFVERYFRSAVKCPFVYVPFGLATGSGVMWCTSKCYVLWQKFW